jgi:WD40 repeat protein
MAVAFSPDGRYLAYADSAENNAIRLVSPDGAQLIKTLEGGQMPIFKLLFSSDSALLAAVDDAGISIRQVEDGKLLYTGKSACP